ncbi:toprim domain-containing protein [Lactobacillus gasseri]|uniref:toprim domain-containing protein n=1 Tax=Lactobacillus gasseri TaxID=1596 RepID=UPI0028F1868E|nr:toprim domain-containing protein [Lactobacillus gasseri]MDT9612279.1 toprim domain-containing protein [Lactobacillus gasseri]
MRFFESSIDALSYYNLNPNKLTNTRFVSMDGLKKEVVASYINLTAKQLAKSGSRLKSIALGVDNDDAGNKFVEKMQKFQARDIDGNVLQILSAQPNTKYGKDWNDVLKHVCQVQASTLKTRLAKKQHIQHREFQLS